MRGMSLAEVEKKVGLSRRVIQECEKYGVALKPGTDKYGHLVYQDEETRRLWLIRFYRETGYRNADLKTVFNNPEFDEEVALEERIDELKKKRDELDRAIEAAEFIKNTTSSIVPIMQSCLPEAEYDSVIDAMLCMKPFVEDEELNAEWESMGIGKFVSDNIEKWISHIGQLFQYGYEIDSPMVNDYFQSIYDEMTRTCMPSPLLAIGQMRSVIGGSLLEREKKKRDVLVEKMIDALNMYCDHGLNEQLELLIEPTLQLAELFFENHDPNDNHVQEAVDSLIMPLAPLQIKNKLVRILHEYIGVLLTKCVPDDVREDEEYMEFIMFIQKAFEIYCEFQSKCTEKEKEYA